MAAQARREPGLDFDRAIAMAEHNPTPRFVVANMNSWNFSKSAFMHAHDPTEERKASIPSIDPRPRTSHGILNRPRRQSFSRPLTSDGPSRSADLPPTPPIPRNIARKEPDAHPASIGVALGSPVVSAPSMSLSGPLSAPFETTSKPPTPPLKAQSNEETVKVRRWKSVGALFRRKSSAQTPSGSSKKAKASPKPEEPTSDPSRPRSSGRRRSFVQSIRPKIKADEPPPIPASFAQDAPGSTTSIGSSPDSGSSPANRAIARVPPPALEPATLNDSPRSSPDSGFLKPATPTLSRARTLSPTSSNFLDVDIPQSRMDRYSVMFSDLLSKPVAGDELEAAPIQFRRQPKAEKLAPLNMNRISSSSPTFVQEPFASRSAPPTNATFPVRNPPPPPAAITQLSDHSGNKPAAYSLFPRTDSPPPVPTAWSLDAPDHDWESYSASPTLGLPENSQADDLPDVSRALRSSSLFGPDESHEHEYDDAYSRRSSARHTLYPPSPPLSSLGSPSVRTHLTPRSSSFRSARSSLESLGLGPTRTHQRNESGVLGALEVNFQPYAPPASQPIDGSTDPHGSLLSPRRSPAQPHVGMAQPVRLSSKHGKPRFLNTSASSSPVAESHEAVAAKARSNARTPTIVHVDNRVSLEDEEAWVRRRSMWGVLDDA